MMDCEFCRLIDSGGSPLVLSLDDVGVLPSRSPEARRHLLVIPKLHLKDLSDLAASPSMLGRLFQDVLVVAHVFKMKRYRIKVNVPGHVEHLHVHLLED
jgi:diadenosine tetraphosphate (Ap4A) HIT family hydrolase